MTGPDLHPYPSIVNTYDRDGPFSYKRGGINYRLKDQLELGHVIGARSVHLEYILQLEKPP